jgi:hypothetical protein
MRDEGGDDSGKVRSIESRLDTSPYPIPLLAATVYTQVEPILPSPPTLREGFAYKKEGTEPEPLKVPLKKGDLGGSERGLGLIQRSVYTVATGRETDRPLPVAPPTDNDIGGGLGASAPNSWVFPDRNVKEEGT